MTHVPRWYDDPKYYQRQYDDHASYYFEAETMRAIVWCVHRLYDESLPLKGDDRRDLAQRLDALTQQAVPDYQT